MNCHTKVFIKYLAIVMVICSTTSRADVGKIPENNLNLPRLMKAIKLFRTNKSRNPVSFEEIAQDLMCYERQKIIHVRPYGAHLKTWSSSRCVFKYKLITRRDVAWLYALDKSGNVIDYINENMSEDDYTDKWLGEK